ncbi:ABC transporter permease [Raineyella fluvialis]|uniref:FtsX-like permease family protein n=1 Tax=Raineyella fluvialis TaxID=2662261 RepID=A0A5Q2FA01_9ACTN|nr:FtsX-like permease family protein [Raineyella fluvialis]QGF23629.1 FtsX-like permease family protein [Raineyella fluvialis]
MSTTVTWTLAWRYLRGRGLRSALTTLAVALSVMLIFGLGGVVPTLVDAFTRSLLSASGKIDLTVTQTLAQPFAPSVVDKVGRVPGIALATGEVEQSAPLPVRRDIPTGQQVSSVTVVGIDPAVSGRIRDLGLASGRALTTTDGDVAVLSADLAGRLGLGLGSPLVLPSPVGSTRFTVVGLLTAATVPGQETVYVPIGAAQTLFGLGAKITTVQASLQPDANRSAVEDAVRTAVGPDYTVGGLSSNSSLLASIQVSRYAFTLFGLFALATAGFIILNSFRTVVAERRRDIGMLRAIGARRRTITGILLVESLLQGVLGTLLGMVLGYLMAAGLFAVMAPMVESVVHLRIGPVRFEPATYAEAIVLGIGLTVLAAIIPARAAGKVTPMEALRPQTEEVYRRGAGVRGWIGVGVLVVSLFCLVTRDASLVGLGSVLFLVGLALVIPAVVHPLARAAGSAVELAYAREGAIARSNLQRNPGRSANTVSAVMLGLASIVAMVTVVQSIFAGFTGYIDRSLSADYLVIPNSIVLGQGNVAAGPKLAADIAHTAGIGPVSTLRLARAKLNGHDVQVIGIDPATYPEVANFEWTAGSTDAALAQLGSGRWLISNGIFAGQSGLTSGQAVTLDTPNGPRVYYVAGVGNDYLNAKLATIYVSQDQLARDFDVTDDLLVMANRKPSADPATVTAAVQRIVDGYPGFKLYESAQWRDLQLSIFNQTYVIFYGLIAALAVPSLLALLNTLAISVLARTRELGMLRAVGATRRQIKRMVVAESLLLSVIGTVFGVAAGLWLGYALVEAMRMIGWPMPWTFPWGGVLLTVVVGIVFGVLAALIPARSAARLDVVAALHHE